MTDTDKLQTHACEVQGKDSPCAARERARIVALIHEHIMRFENGEYYGSGVGEYDEVVALKRLLRAVEETSHE